MIADITKPSGSVPDSKPYETITQKELRSKLVQMEVNDSFLAYNYKSNYNYGTVRSQLCVAAKRMLPKKFISFHTVDGLRIYRTY